MHSERLSRAVPVLRVLAAIGAIALVAVVAIRAARHVDFTRLTWWPLALALVGAAAWWLLLARGWALLVTGHGNRRDIRQWCRTQALRYLPGGVWAPVSRAAVVEGGLLHRITTVGAENIISLCCALAIGALAMAASGRIAYAPGVLLVAAPLAAVRMLGGRTALRADRVRLATENGVAAFVIYAGAAIAVQAAVSGLTHPLLVAGAAAVAWGAGLVVIVAPGGIGVREVVYVALMGSALPSGDLALAAVSMRLVMVVAELGVLVAAR